jgi:hypothetical protein
MWNKWSDQSKPWSKLELEKNETEAALFRACTTIAVGNGTCTKFWNDKWLQGQIPKEIAPNIFKLAWRKNHTPAQGLNAGKWMQGLQRKVTSEEIEQFIKLWSLIAQVQRTVEPDKITWPFIANGVYTSRSAYHAQFIGSYTDYEWNRVWTEKGENKCRFFAWLLLQNKIWTSDRITRNGEQANPIFHTSWHCAPCQEQYGRNLHPGVAPASPKCH